uniref:Uncharacterized protein n=1 Tax=Panagrolaimus sp. JU765 TaxID=591449 RepID=A0AC34QMU4_9BILA
MLPNSVAGLALLFPILLLNFGSGAGSSSQPSGSVTAALGPDYNFDLVEGILGDDAIIDGSGEYLDDDPANFHPPDHYRLEHYLKTNYNSRVLPRRQSNETVNVSIKMEIYQIIEINEPQQYILLNAWLVERWNDDLLYWNPARFGGLREISLPKDAVWLPDTTLYNSLQMDENQSRKLINVKITTLPKERTTLVELLYPTLYKSSCLLDLRTFPFDLQSCKLVFGSWTHDNKAINYFPHNVSGKPAISTRHCIENEEWNVLGTKVVRKELKFDCCANNYTLLEFHIHLQRKPLYYVVNLIMPTAIITLIAIFGFFSSSTINDVREEKMSLGITTLLSMSILIFMVSDKMPNMGTSVPLIGWYYTSSITLISTATLAASLVIFTQKKGIIGKRPTRKTMRWARRLGKILMVKMPLLMVQAYQLKAKQDKIRKASQRKQSVWQKWYKISKELRKDDTELVNINHPSGIRFADEDDSISDDETKSWDASAHSWPNGAENVGFQPSRSVSLSSTNAYSVKKPAYMSLDLDDGLDLSNLTALQQRNLAQIEWDWIAAVFERAFLVMFNFFFWLTIVCVALIGFYCCYIMVDLNDTELDR